jgi:PAS domain S-box-containing protein
VGLGASLVLTVTVWLLVQRTDQARLEDLQEAHATAIAVRLDGRMKGLGQILKGASSYLGRGALPTRAEWKGYVASLDLPGTYPGIQGLGFAEWVPGPALAAHLQRLRKEGFPSYTVLPGGPLAEDPEGVSAIIYLEPMDTRNQRAFGKNMLREPVRREAMLRARDTGFLALTGPITLYQEQGSDIQAGTLLLAPVYLQGLPRDTVADRRAAFRGWVHLTFRMTDLIAASLARELRQAELKLFDDAGPGGLGLLFDSDPAYRSSSQGAPQTRSVEVAGRTWMVQVQPNAAFFAEAGQRHHWEILAGGLTASLLLFVLLVTLHGAEARARLLAHVRGEELLATEAQFRALFESAPFGMAIVDSTSGRFLSVNARLGEILGYGAAELEARDFQSVTHPEHLTADLASVRQLASGALREIHKEKRYIHQDGHVVWARLSMVPLPSGPQAPRRHLAIVEDISQARSQSEAVRASEALYHGLFDLSPDGVVLIRLRDQVLLEVNQTWEQMTGVSRAQALGRTTLELDLYRDAAQRTVIYENLPESGKSGTWPMSLIRRDGVAYEAEITANVLEVEGEKLVFVVLRDVSDRKQAEARMLETLAEARRFREALDQVGVYVYIKDLQSRYLYGNQHTLGCSGSRRRNWWAATTRGSSPPPRWICSGASMPASSRASPPVRKWLCLMPRARRRSIGRSRRPSTRIRSAR